MVNGWSIITGPLLAAGSGLDGWQMVHEMDG